MKKDHSSLPPIHLSTQPSIVHPFIYQPTYRLVHLFIYVFIYYFISFLTGTCINNTSVMMFKKGSFEIGGVVYPVAIKVL